MRTRLLALLLVLVCPVVLSCGSGIVSGFEWEVTPEQRTIERGQTATFLIKIKKKVNINANVELRVTGAPADATTSLDPPIIPDTSQDSTLRISTTTSTVEATYNLKVFAKEVGQATEYELERLLLVTASGGAPDFSLGVDPLHYAFPNLNHSPTFTYYIRPLSGFLGTVNIEVIGLGDDYVLSAPVTPPSVTITGGGKGGTFVIQPVVAPPTPPMTYAKVRATSGSIVHEQTIALEFPPS